MLRVHLALLAITELAAVGWGFCPLAWRVLCWSLAFATLASAPYWLLRGGRGITAALMGIALFSLAMIILPPTLGGEQWAPSLAILLAMVQTAAVVAVAVARTFVRSPVGLEIAGALGVCGIVAIFSSSPEPPLHFVAGGYRSDQGDYFDVRPHSHGVHFYRSNPRHYFRDLGPPGASHWWAWQLDWTGESSVYGRAILTPDDPEAVRLEIAAPASNAAETLTWSCNYWPGAAGGPLTLSVKARAAVQGAAVLRLRNREQRQQVSHRIELDLRPEWQRFHIEVLPGFDTNMAAVALEFSGRMCPVELADFSESCDGVRQEIQAPLSQYLVEYQANSLGFRDREYVIPRPPGVFRIVCLGDSLTWGQGVHLEDTYAKVLERNFNQTGDDSPQIEVINCGQAGYHTGQERVCFEHTASRLEPNLVVLQVFENDFAPIPPPAQEKLNSGPFWARQGADRYERCVQEIARLADACQQRQASLVVMIFRTDAKHYEWRMFERAFLRAERLRETPLLDIGDAVIARGRGQVLHVHETDLHPNDLAHRFVAEELARFLIAEQLIPAAQ